MKKQLVSSLTILGLSVVPGAAHVGASALALCLAVLPGQALAGGDGHCAKESQALNETAQSVIARHLQALGGEEKLKAAKTLQLTATTYEGEKTSKMTVRRSRPGQMRYDISKDGTQIVKAFDGKTGWYQEGSAAPKAIEPEKLTKMAEKASFDDVLVDHAKKDVKVELAGVVDLGGTQAYKLVLTRGTDVEARFLDKQSFLEVKRVSTFTHEGKTVKKAVKFSDYRNVDGIMVNFASEWEYDGVKGKMVVESAQYGGSIDPAVYRMPAARS